MTEDAYSCFIHQYPQYLETSAIDALRKKEYRMLDVKKHTYLDFTGGGLYAVSQLKAHYNLLSQNIFGNPHSYSPTSYSATELVEKARTYVLKYFNAPPDEYVCVFTQNASGALKIIGESYPFGKGCRYVLIFDNHNSVNGIREYAHAKGASVQYIPVVLPDLRVDEDVLFKELGTLDRGCFNLFAFPAQSNFSGVQHPLAWIEKAHSLGWDVLLDAAAFAPTNRLDLGKWKPDFVPLSFYKMFGFPTGIGALLARKDAINKLRRSWFAGGTITVASVRGKKYYPADAPARFEDGTVDYLNIPAVEIGLRHLEKIGMDTIHKRVRILTGWLLDELNKLKHQNGVPLIKVYGPLSTDRRGGTVALNFFDINGDLIRKSLLEKEANRRNISIRMGFFCNPGAGEVALDISTDELASCFSSSSYSQRLTDLDFQHCIDPKASGAVRVSIGLVSNFADIQAFLSFAASFLNH
ncbi:MAG: aminotransferase class V-fold PLP-dependent enzyme [Anaerolineaceae bacterium]|nr:aminotransferase class V-fold PLP-dependent enzyme [Anaerolineaceae bacterium]